ncbi:MAG: hypothetical protein OEZ58_00250 [Gammaproteobacteria bacterium]|nr:hypothetical protein [Gammaproteobacteria bacterium]
MEEFRKVSFNCESKLWQEIVKYSRKNGIRRNTDALEVLLKKGLSAEQELEEMRRREDYILLKTLFILRNIAVTRGDDFLKSLDEQFEEKLPKLREMIINEGMDYGDG